MYPYISIFLLYNMQKKKILYSIINIAKLSYDIYIHVYSIIVRLSLLFLDNFCITLYINTAKNLKFLQEIYYYAVQIIVIVLQIKILNFYKKIYCHVV